MKNILVTGGAGYIGSHTVKELQKNLYNCIVLDNLVYGHAEFIQDCIFVQGDLLQSKVLEDLFNSHKIDAVVHFAAFAYVGESVQDPNKYFQNNVVGSLNLLNSMLKYNVKNIVFSSSCATYGEPSYTPIDELHPQNPINPYGTTKLVIEKALESFRQAYDFNYISLRYFNAAGCDRDGIIGERHEPETHLIPLVLKAIKGEISELSVYGNDHDTPDGTCIRDYVHVEDLARAHRLSLEKLNSFSGAINIGSGQGTSVNEIIRAAEDVTETKCPVTYSQKRPGDPAILYSSIQKAKEILNWEPEFKNIKDIIKTAWAWENHH